MSGLLAKIRHYLGKDLPERVLALNFALPKVSDRLKAVHSDDRALDEVKDSPSEYFRVLLTELRHVNRCALKQQQRLVLVNDALKYFYPMALAQIARHAKTGGVPEAEDRRHALNLMVDITQILIVSCQILFANYYGLSNFQYARSRRAILQCALRIFELVTLKQQARALRYQILSEQDWQLVNTLFYVMSKYEDVGQPLPTLQKELGLDGGRSTASLREQFAQLHVVARFDMLHWPCHLQWVVESYLRGVEHAVQIRLDNGSATRNELIAYCYGGNPASVHPLAVPPGPALILNCTGLTDAIRKDCMGLLLAKKNRDASALPPRFARFPEDERFVISDQLVRGLGNGLLDESVERETRIEDLRIFVGFAEVFALLRHKQGLYASEERLADMLAKRSALIAEDDVATEKSVWSLLFQNDRMIRLSTQETAFTTPMMIGSLLAYGVGDDINRPRLAVVSRIFRPSNKVVVIDMQCIAGYAEAVMMTVNVAEQTTNGLRRGTPALLVYGGKHCWELMFPPQDILPGFDKIAIYRNQQEFAIEPGSRRNATHDFHLNATSLTSEQLGIVGEPEYAAMPSGKLHAAGLLI